MPMLELRQCFEEAGFKHVVTYINSGNVIFESNETSLEKLVDVCEGAIEGHFGFKVICSVISADDLVEAVAHAPRWWNVGEAKHNAIFVIAPKNRSRNHARSR